jgi:hypothetical protein
MFRFTIRDVLWLMVVVAVWLGWWRYCANRDAQLQAVALSREQNHKQHLETVLKLHHFEIQERLLNARIQLLTRRGSLDEARDVDLRNADKGLEILKQQKKVFFERLQSNAKSGDILRVSR